MAYDPYWGTNGGRPIRDPRALANNLEVPDESKSQKCLLLVNPKVERHCLSASTILSGDAFSSGDVQIGEHTGEVSNIAEVPLGAKLPVIPGNRNVLTTTRLCKKIHETSADFDSTYPIDGTNVVNDYRCLHDRHLSGYFSQEEIHAHLQKRNFITDNDQVKCSIKEYNKYREYLKRLYIEKNTKTLREEYEAFSNERKRAMAEWIYKQKNDVNNPITLRVEKARERRNMVEGKRKSRAKLILHQAKMDVETIMEKKLQENATRTEREELREREREKREKINQIKAEENRLRRREILLRKHENEKLLQMNLDDKRHNLRKQRQNIAEERYQRKQHFHKHKKIELQRLTERREAQRRENVERWKKYFADKLTRQRKQLERLRKREQQERLRLRMEMRKMQGDKKMEITSTESRSSVPSRTCSEGIPTIPQDAAWVTLSQVGFETEAKPMESTSGEYRGVADGLITAAMTAAGKQYVEDKASYLVQNAILTAQHILLPLLEDFECEIGDIISDTDLPAVMHALINRVFDEDVEDFYEMISFDQAGGQAAVAINRESDIRFSTKINYIGGKQQRDTRAAHVKLRDTVQTRQISQRQSGLVVRESLIRRLQRRGTGYVPKEMLPEDDSDIPTDILIKLAEHKRKINMQLLKEGMIGGSTMLSAVAEDIEEKRRATGFVPKALFAQLMQDEDMKEEDSDLQGSSELQGSSRSPSLVGEVTSDSTNKSAAQDLVANLLELIVGETQSEKSESSASSTEYGLLQSDMSRLALKVVKSALLEIEDTSGSVASSLEQKIQSLAVQVVGEAVEELKSKQDPPVVIPSTMPGLTIEGEAMEVDITESSISSTVSREERRILENKIAGIATNILQEVLTFADVKEVHDNTFNAAQEMVDQLIAAVGVPSSLGDSRVTSEMSSAEEGKSELSSLALNVVRSVLEETATRRFEIDDKSTSTTKTAITRTTQTSTSDTEKSRQLIIDTIHEISGRLVETIVDDLSVYDSSEGAHPNKGKEPSISSSKRSVLEKRIGDVAKTILDEILTFDDTKRIEKVGRKAAANELVSKLMQQLKDRTSSSSQTATETTDTGTIKSPVPITNTEIQVPSPITEVSGTSEIATMSSQISSNDSAICETINLLSNKIVDQIVNPDAPARDLDFTDRERKVLESRIGDITNEIMKQILTDEAKLTDGSKSAAKLMIANLIGQISNIDQRISPLDIGKSASSKTESSNYSTPNLDEDISTIALQVVKSALEGAPDGLTTSSGTDESQFLTDITTQLLKNVDRETHSKLLSEKLVESLLNSEGTSSASVSDIAAKVVRSMIDTMVPASSKSTDISSIAEKVVQGIQVSTIAEYLTKHAMNESSDISVTKSEMTEKVVRSILDSADQTSSLGTSEVSRLAASVVRSVEIAALANRVVAALLTSSSEPPAGTDHESGTESTKTPAEIVRSILTSSTEVKSSQLTSHELSDLCGKVVKSVEMTALARLLVDNLLASSASSKTGSSGKSATKMIRSILETSEAASSLSSTEVNNLAARVIRSVEVQSMAGRLVDTLIQSDESKSTTPSITPASFRSSDLAETIVAAILRPSSTETRSDSAPLDDMISSACQSVIRQRVSSGLDIDPSMINISHLANQVVNKILYSQISSQSDSDGAVSSIANQIVDSLLETHAVSGVSSSAITDDVDVNELADTIMRKLQVDPAESVTDSQLGDQNLATRIIASVLDDDETGSTAETPLTTTGESPFSPIQSHVSTKSSDLNELASHVVRRMLVSETPSGQTELVDVEESAEVTEVSTLADEIVNTVLDDQGRKVRTAQKQQPKRLRAKSQSKRPPSAALEERIHKMAKKMVTDAVHDVRSETETNLSFTLKLKPTNAKKSKAELCTDCKTSVCKNCQLNIDIMAQTITRILISHSSFDTDNVYSSSSESKN